MILLEPGTISSHPEMGVGIVSKYRYSFEGSASNLKNDIMKQIQVYLPNFLGVDVQVSEKDSSFDIKIVVDDVLYDFSFDSNVGTLTGLISL